jgi:hypothetical protein
MPEEIWLQSLRRDVADKIEQAFLVVDRYDNLESEVY